MSIVKVGGEILVNTATAGGQNTPEITTLANGGFVVAWRDLSFGVGGASGDSRGLAVKAQVFTAAGAPVGAEILVNTATEGEQSVQKIAALSNGGFAVTWMDLSFGFGGASGDASGYAVKAQLFTAAGAPVGTEILVNAAVANNQQFQQVVALSEGRFVVTWQDSSNGVGGATGDDSGTAIKAQLFSATGTPIGTEIRVNSATESSQNSPQITALSDGGFVITWEDDSQGIGGTGGDTSGRAIKAQSFDVDGAAAGTEILVNTAVTDDQEAPTITALSGGGFVIAWRDDSRGVGGATGDASSYAVKAQVFTAAGAPVGTEILVNTATASTQTNGQITALWNGGFVATWQDHSLGVGGASGDGSGAAIKAQVFAADGAAVGTEIRVNSATANNQTFPQVTTLSDGGFVVTWQDASLGVGGTGGDTSSNAVKAQVFTAAGAPVGTEILVNTAIAGSQGAAKITAIANGGFVVAWQDSSQGVGGTGGDTSSMAIKAQVFAPDEAPTLADAGGTTAFVEAANVASAPVAVAGGLTVADDGATLASATVSITANFQAGQDALAFANAAGMGNIAGSYDATTGVLTLTSAGASATVAQWQAALRSVTYVNSSDTPDTADRTISFTVNDGTSDSVAATQTVSVAAMNDAPSGTDGTVVANEDEPLTLTTADFGFTDPDGHSLAAVTIVTLPTAGTLSLYGAPVVAGSLIAAVDIATGKLVFTPAANASGVGYASLTFQVTDAGGTAGDGTDTDASANTLTFDVTAVNDDPSGTDRTVVANEDEPLTLTTADFGFTDPDGHSLASVTITALPGAGVLRLGGVAVTVGQTVDAADIADGDLIFTPAANDNGEGYASLSFEVRDSTGAADASPNTLTIDVEPANDLTVVGGGGGSSAYTIGGSPVAVATSVTVADLEDETHRATVRIVDGYRPGEDELRFTPTSQTGDITGAFDDDVGAMVLRAGPDGATAAQMQAAVRAVTYVNTAASPDLSARTVSIQINDGYGFSNTVTRTLTVAAAPAPDPDPDPDPGPPPPPPDPSVMVDGVPVTIVTAPGAGGGAPTQTVTVPVVTSNRPDTVGGANVADIALVTRGGAPLLSVQAPTGYGLTANGPSAPQTAGSSLNDLIREIQAHTTAGSADQTMLTGGGGGFLGALPSTTPLLVQTITPTGGGPSTQPLVIDGGSGVAGDPITALVIDTRGLTSGSTLQLNNVDFAAVIGTVTLTGGAGSQVVYGDGASQVILLGEDDDVLHGGGGADTVASTGGDDQLFGGEGADSVSGGVGDDFVHGNAGADTVSGGDGNDAAYGGKDDDRISGDAGSDLVWGDLGNDFLHGNAGADTVDGGLGADSVHGGQGDDYVSGGDGDDIVLGDLGDDFVQGGVGHDRVFGGAGNDIVHGGQGDDLVEGGDGDDWLSGDRGNDTLTGGTGADTFHAYAQMGRDVVLDFNAAEGDRVVVDVGHAYTVSQGAGGVMITFGAEHQMLLQGVQMSTLAEGWIVAG